MLDNISTEDLEKEIERRKNKDKEKKPEQVMLKDFKPLVNICQEYVDSLDNKGYVNENLEHYIFEMAMNCVFGSEVWQWVNKQ